MAGTTTAPGPAKFAAFLKANGITYTEAAKQLRTSRVTVGHWAVGYKRPGDVNRARIKVWSRGEIVPDDWREPGEVSEASAVAPFTPPAESGALPNAEAAPDTGTDDG